MKRYLPIISAEKVEIVEISNSFYEANTTLQILYYYLECNMIEKVNFNNKYDFIIDEEGTFKNHKYGYSLPNFPNELFANNIFVGKSTIVRFTDDGSWKFFTDKSELQDLLKKYINERKVYQKANY